MTEIAEILAAAEGSAREQTARILLRQELHARHAELEAEIEALDRDSPELDGLLDQLEALQAEMDKAKTRFVFRSVGHRKWADLVAEHPPTKEQVRAGSNVNLDTFRIPAIALASYDPKMTVEDVERLADLPVMNHSMFEMLFMSAVQANIGGLTDPKSAALGMRRRLNGASAERRTTSKSRARSSSAGS